jgi:aspartyl-tRNA(Asn)/glutamyl-tRNA(Gln) amidotransferase subunit A
MSDWRTIAELAAAIRAGRVSPVEVTRACLDRIERLDGRLRSFITVDPEGALRVAREREAELAAGRWRGPLHGVPLAHKDLFHVEGLPTSCGTRTARYFAPAHESTAVSRLAAAGAVTLGKLNTSEIASGPFGNNDHHGDVQNPWRPGHASGGSSAGSGAAVAAGLVLGALGSDTGGSVRLPAACCGIAGLKPTYGRVSRSGVMPLSWSLDHVGPMARTVADVALMLGVIAGHDPRDATTSHRPVPDCIGALEAGIGGLRLGVPENYYFDGVAPEMAAAVRAAAGTLAGLGAKVAPVRLPDPAVLQEIGNIISRVESAATHARLLRERPEEVQPYVLRRLEVGFHVPAYDYVQAMRLRSRLTREFVAEVFAGVDALVAPATPEPAPSYAAVKDGGPEPMVARMGQFARLTRPFNALGLPALAVPCGFAADGRPLAMQVVARPFAEATALRVGHAYERATAWHTRRPPDSDT